MDLTPVNNFFFHLIKEIAITKYGNDKQLMPTFSSYEIYYYSDAMLKHLPEKSLKRIKKTMLYSNKPVTYNKTTIDRRAHNSNTAADITDDYLDHRIDKFQDQLKTNLSIEFLFDTFPLRYGNVSFSLKIDFKIKRHIEIEKKKLFEFKKK